MQNNEITKYTSGINMDDIERIDFSNIDYEQINNLGSKTLKEFACVSEKFRLSQSANKEVDEINYLTLINNLNIDSYFEQYDEKLEKIKEKSHKKNKSALSNNGLVAALNHFTNFFSKLLPEKEEEKEFFSDVEEKYVTNIDNLVIIVQQRLDILRIEADENKAIKQILIKLNEKLNKTIKFASSDLDDYQNSVVIPLKTKERTKEEEMQYQMSLTIVKVVESKINDLKESLAINENILYQRDILILNNMPIASDYKKFIDTIAPSLKMNARTAIDVKIQNERIKAQHLLNNKINASLIIQSDMLNENIQESSRLITEGTIKEDTYKNLVSSANEATKLLLEARKNEEKSISSKNEILDTTIKSLEQNTSTLRSLLFESSVDNSTLNLESGKGLIKK